MDTKFNNHSQKYTSHTAKNRVVLAFVLILAGVLLLASNFGILGPVFSGVLFSWPMLIIAIGLIIFLTKPQSRVGSIIMVLIGVYFLGIRFFDFHFSFWRVFVPGLLILAGILIILRMAKPSGKHYGARGRSGDYIEDVAIFGGNKVQVTAQNFKGGDIVAILGGSHYDLRQAQMQEGVNVLEVVCLLGSTQLIVPSDWDVRVEMTGLFGGFTDKRLPLMGGQRDYSRQLVIKGVAFMGGGEITSA